MCPWSIAQLGRKSLSHRHLQAVDSVWKFNAGVALCVLASACVHVHLVQVECDACGYVSRFGSTAFTCDPGAGFVDTYQRFGPQAESVTFPDWSPCTCGRGWCGGGSLVVVAWNNHYLVCRCPICIAMKLHGASCVVHADCTMRSSRLGFYCRVSSLCKSYPWCSMAHLVNTIDACS